MSPHKNHKLLYTFPMVALIVVLALIWGSQQPIYGQADGVLPWVINTLPMRGDELPIQQGVTFTFNTPMSRGSVEAAFHVSPAAPGFFQWQDETTFTYTPAKPFDRATAYIFEIDSRARSLEGLELRGTFSLKLYTTGYLAVTQFLPQDEFGVSVSERLTIVFNRPVVPLGTAAQMQNMPAPFKSDPVIVGRGEWLTTSIYHFTPTNLLQGDTQYTITIPASLTDVSGSSPKEDTTFRFKTFSAGTPKAQSFSIHYFNPQKGKTGIYRRPVIQVGFDVPVDTASAEAGFTLIAPDGRVIAGKFEWKGENYELRFRPDEPLDYNTTYIAKINRKRVRSKTGLPLSTDASTYFTTLGLPQIVSTSPHDGSLVDPSATVLIKFSAPMKLDDLARRLEINPKTPNVVLDADIDADSTAARVQFSTLPSTIYTVTLDTKGMVDIWGTPLRIIPQDKVYKIVGKDRIQFRYVTSALGSAVSLETAGQTMGLYNAHHQTRVFVTHRNIGTVGMTLYNLSLPLFLNTSNNSYRAPDEQETLVRRWVIPVYNPKNIMRYDLLSITTEGTSIGQQGNVVCVEAAPSNLAVGQQVRVVRREIPEDEKTTPTAPAPINMRNEPGLQNTVVIFRAAHGTEFVVLDGPVCADRYTWWKVQSEDGSLNGWIAEGDLKQPYVVPLTEPGEMATPAPSAEGESAASAPSPGLPPGIYRLELEAPEISDESHHLTHVMLIATDNITLKVAQREALAWVTDLKSGKPAAGLAVQFYRLMQLANGQKVLPYGKPVMTDQDGFARLEVSEELYPAGEVIYAAVVSDNHFALTASTWVQGIDAYDFQQPTMFHNRDLALYLYTDRRLYRLGDQVYFKGTIRNRDDAVYSLSDKTLIPVDIIDPFNQVIYSKKLPVNAYGSFSDSFTVASGGQLGEYRIIARPNKPDPEPPMTPTTTPPMVTNPIPTNTPTPFPQASANQHSDDPQFETVITVADYTPPEYRVVVKPQSAHVAPGDTIRVAVEGSYYFGGAVSNAAVQWYVRTDPYYFYYTGSGSYSFEDYNQDNIAQDYEDDRPRAFSSGMGRTNDEGRYLIEIPAALGKSRRSLIYTLEAIVWDESNQMVAERAQIIVDQGQFQVGVGVENYVGTVNGKQLVRLISVNHDSSPLPNTDVQVRVVRRVWAGVQTIEPGTGRTVWENDVIEKEVASGPVRTDSSGRGNFSFIPQKGGAYKVYVSAPDLRGNLIKASTFIWIAGPEFVAWRAPNSNRIDLQADKTRYKVGETASILIPTPFQGESLALITVERGGILKKEVVRLHHNSTIYELPITPDMAPNAFVSVTVIKGEDEHNYSAAFRTGLIQLSVDTERLRLNVTIKSDQKKAGPREQITYRIHVTNYKGEPIQAEVGLALVDEAILSLMPDNLPSLMSYFYYRQGLGVRTANALIFNVDQTTQEIINVHKGGGKGGDDYFGIFTIRKDFIGTPLWNPFVVTDANGDATITVTLPDQLTTWVLDARAYTLATGDTQTTLVGQTIHSLTSTKPLLIRPEVPRFFVKGDTSLLSAIVNNNTVTAQQVAVSLEISGAAIQGDLVQYATIPANGRLKFDWFMIALDSQNIEMTFKVATRDGRLTDAAKPVTGKGDERLIPVLRYETPDTVTTGGVIGNEGGSRTEGVMVPIRKADGSSPNDALKIRIERSLASGMTNALKTLKIFPHYCIEQTISRFLPDVVMFQAQKLLGYDDPRLFEELSDTVEAGLQRLYSDQHVDGGWGWFVNDKSDNLISAYAVLGMVEAKGAGWAVDDNVLRKALEGLRAQSVEGKTPWWELNRQAFLHYMQAHAGQIIRRTENKELVFDLGSAITLFDQRDRMNLDAQAFLAMAFRIITPNAHHSVTLMEDIKRAAKRSLTGVYWEDTNADAWNWTTNTRTTAIILKALVEIEPTSPLIPDAVRWLMTARKFDAWETTQETAWSVMALSAWMLRTGDLTPDYHFSIALNEQPSIPDESATLNNARTPYDLSVPLSSLLDNQINRIGIKRSAGSGTLYYSTELKTHLPVEEIKALSRGLFIERTYSREDDPAHSPITTAQMGERIRVTLTIVVPETLNYVVIEDPIPAGTQSINTSLHTTPKLDLREPLRYGWGYWAFTHTELRDDRTVLYAPYLPRGTYQFIYQIRAGAVGTYHVLPATGHTFYMPEVFGRTSGGMFMVIPEDKTF